MKVGALIHSMKFLSPEVALYLNKSTALPCMDYCCHVWACASSLLLELLDKLQKPICRTVVSFLAAPLKPLAHQQNVASLSLLDRYYFGNYVYLNWIHWLHVLILKGVLLVSLIDSMIFLSSSLDVTRMSMLTVSFLTQVDSRILCL